MSPERPNLGARAADQRPSPSNWSRAARAAHWLTAISALGGAGFVLVLINPPDWSNVYLDRYDRWIGVHKLLGIVALIGLIALILQHAHRPARTGPSLMRRVSALTQIVLALLTIVLAASGLIGALLSTGISVNGFQLVPPVSARPEAIASLLASVHDVCGYAFLAVAAAHVGAALHHHFIARDGVLARMLGTNAPDGRSE
ncbi:MAG: cytochrome b/b6 domain-containing protein [Hyphomonadaceae bacterium]